VAERQQAAERLADLRVQQDNGADQFSFRHETRPLSHRRNGGRKGEAARKD
jgi:hypothetical protein